MSRNTRDRPGEVRVEWIAIITRSFRQGWQVLLLWLLAVLLTAVWMVSPESSRATVAILAILYALALLATRRWLREQKGRASRGPEPQLDAKRLSGSKAETVRESDEQES